MGTRLGQQRFVNGIRVFRRNWTQREFYEERVSIVPITGCWMWMSWIDKCGYGKMAGPGHSQLAHRCSYEHSRRHGAGSQVPKPLVHQPVPFGAGVRLREPAPRRWYRRQESPEDALPVRAPLFWGQPHSEGPAQRADQSTVPVMPNHAETRPLARTAEGRWRVRHLFAGVSKMVHALAHLLRVNGCRGLIDFDSKPRRYGVRCAKCGREKWFA